MIIMSKEKPSAIKDKQFIFSFLFLFLLVQIVGLFVAYNYYLKDIQFSVFGDPNSIFNAIFIVGYIIFLTGIILILKKYFKSGKYIFVFEFLALFFAIGIIFEIFLPFYLAYFLAVVLLFFKNKFESKKITLWYNNLLLALAIAGAGALLGLGLGILPIIILLALLAIYDIVAVFYTKHMISLAKLIIAKKVSLIFLLPSKRRLYRLGGGDFAIPTAVSSSLFNVLIKSYSFSVVIIPIIFVWISAVLGMFLTFYILDKKKIKALPALPIQVGLMIIVIVITYFTLLY